MVAKYWPVAGQKEENASLFPVKRIDRSAVAEYLKFGHKYTLRGITLYTKPTVTLEVGFLIRRKAGNAVQRNRTRRIFSGLLLNESLFEVLKGGYLFLFHKSFGSTPALEPVVALLIDRSQRDDQ